MNARESIRRYNSVVRKLTAIVKKEGDGYWSLCPELDIASQGDTAQEARDNLREAVELFFETASRQEIKQQLRGNVARRL